MKTETLTFHGVDNTGGRWKIKIDLATQNQWTHNCHGVASTSVTYAAINVDGNCWTPVRVVKHFNDPDNPVLARTMVLKKLFSRYWIPKEVRAKLWGQLGLKLSTSHAE